MYRSICCRVIIFLSGNHNLIILLWKENLCYPYQNNVILLMCQKGFIKFPREIHTIYLNSHIIVQNIIYKQIFSKIPEKYVKPYDKERFNEMPFW
jgi:hypothetical protein